MTESDPSSSKRPSVLQPTSNPAPPPTEAEFEAALAQGRANAKAARPFLLPSARSSNRYP